MERLLLSLRRASRNGFGSAVLRAYSVPATARLRNVPGSTGFGAAALRVPNATGLGNLPGSTGFGGAALRPFSLLTTAGLSNLSGSSGFGTPGRVFTAPTIAGIGNTNSLAYSTSSGIEGAFAGLRSRLESASILWSRSGWFSHFSLTGASTAGTLLLAVVALWYEVIGAKASGEYHETLKAVERKLKSVLEGLKTVVTKLWVLEDLLNVVVDCLEETKTVFVDAKKVVADLKGDARLFVDNILHVLTAAYSEIIALYREALHKENSSFQMLLPNFWQRIIDSFSPEARDLFEREFTFFDKVTSISGVLFPLPKVERRTGIRRELEKIEVIGDDLYLPTAPNRLVRSIQLDSGIPPQSAAKVPIVITFKVVNRGGNPEDIKPQDCIFKKERWQNVDSNPATNVKRCHRKSN